MPDMATQARTLAQAARTARATIATASGEQKNTVLLTLATLLDKKRAHIQTANRRDLKAGKDAGLSPALLDRLTLSPARIDGMIDGVRQIAALPDPVGILQDGWVRPNGLRLSRVRVPLGTVLILFESRPNVTIDAAALCLKSGNAAILRGGREAIHTNTLLGNLLQQALRASHLPEDTVQVVRSTDRALVPELLSLDGHIDVVVPRGGRGLIEAVLEHARMPVLKHLDGICHVYVDAGADPEMAHAIALNAKTQRPGVCNAMETLLVHKGIAKTFLPACMRSMRKAGVTLRGDAATRRLCKGIAMASATEEDWDTEYLDLILSVRVVEDLEEAITHINTHGSGHTDAIVTRDIDAATRFKKAVESASVMVNASTRWADGFEYGLGAEIGISTDKLHARGPVGLEGLTTYKWIVEGDGQCR